MNEVMNVIKAKGKVLKAMLDPDDMIEVSFRELIPMPKIYKDIHWMYSYHAECFDDLLRSHFQIEQTENLIEQLKIVLFPNGLNTENWEEILNEIFKITQEIVENAKALEQLSVTQIYNVDIVKVYSLTLTARLLYGCATEEEFSKVHYGAVNETCETFLSSKEPMADEDVYDLWFKSSDNNPRAYFIALSKSFPNEMIEVKFADEDLGANCGCYHLLNGEVRAFTGNETYKSTEEWAEFACQIFHGMSIQEWDEE